MKTKPPIVISAASTSNVTSRAAGLSSPTVPAKKELVDYTKHYSNSHRAFTSHEARAMTELMHTEEFGRKKYQQVKDHLKRPRNPLMGDETPRDQYGVVVMNPKNFDKVSNGEYLFQKCSPDGNLRPSTTANHYRRPASKEPVGKIGVDDNLYHILGNRDVTETSSHSENLYEALGKEYEAKQHRRQQQEALNQYIAKEKAKRYEKHLKRHLLCLQKEAEEKIAELNFLKSNYNL